MAIRSLCSETDDTEALQQLLQRPVQYLAILLAEETRKFLDGLPNNDQVGLALFTLAIVRKNQDAWDCLYKQYRPLVLNWLTRSSQTAQIIARDGDTTPLINNVFAKFFQAMSETKFKRFDSLGSLLKYLQRCAYCVAADQSRSARSSHDVYPLDEIEEDPATDDPADGVLAVMEAQHLWRVIQEVVKSEDERLLLYQTYVVGMKPIEIHQNARHLFPTVDDVYRVKRNVLERLRRNKRVREEFAEDSPCKCRP